MGRNLEMVAVSITLPPRRMFIGVREHKKPLPV